MNHDIIAREFFGAYTSALLARDAKAIAGQYEGVSTTDAAVEVVAATEHSIWADATWNHHGGAPDERNMYQLVRGGEGWKIAVLTPLDA